MNYKQSAFIKNIKALINSLPKDSLKKSLGTKTDQSFSDDMLPFVLYKNTRQNIEKVADQINKSYFFGIYDGCAVLMRRLLEMLLILSYKHFNIEQEIHDVNGEYFKLSKIVNLAILNSTLDLSRNSKDYLNPFREKGNLSAHNPFHNAVKKDLELVQPKFRHLVEELFYKAGIRK